MNARNPAPEPLSSAPTATPGAGAVRALPERDRAAVARAVALISGVAR